MLRTLYFLFGLTSGSLTVLYGVVSTQQAMQVTLFRKVAFIAAVSNFKGCMQDKEYNDINFKYCYINAVLLNKQVLKSLGVTDVQS